MIDLRTAFVFHAAADLDHDAVAAAVAAVIDDLLEVLDLPFRRGEELEIPHRRQRTVVDDPLLDEVAVAHAPQVSGGEDKRRFPLGVYRDVVFQQDDISLGIRYVYVAERGGDLLPYRLADPHLKGNAAVDVLGIPIEGLDKALQYAVVGQDSRHRGKVFPVMELFVAVEGHGISSFLLYDPV